MVNRFARTQRAKLVAGNVQRRLLGVVLLGVGLAVQMVGNLAAL
jgi:hypothetical protein